MLSSADATIRLMFSVTSNPGENPMETVQKLLAQLRDMVKKVAKRG